MKRSTKLITVMLLCLSMVLPTLAHAESEWTKLCADQGHPLAISHVTWEQCTPINESLHKVERRATGTCACGAVKYDEEKYTVSNEAHTLVNGVCPKCGYGTAQPTPAVTEAPAEATVQPTASADPDATPAPTQSVAPTATPGVTATPAPARPKTTPSTKQIKTRQDAVEVAEANVGHFLVPTSNVNVRAEASASSTRLGGVDADTRHLITGYAVVGNNNIWYQIEFEDKKGYIASGLVTIESNAEAPGEGGEEAQSEEETPGEAASAPDVTNAPAAPAAAAGKLQVGQYVTFGQFEQDGVIENGQEPIVWQVLEVNNPKGRALLVSVDALAAMPFDEYGSSAWMDSSLRAWLNQSFCPSAFTPAQQTALRMEYVDNPFYTLQHADDEKDLVFVISAQDDRLFGTVTVSSYDSMGIYTGFHECRPSKAAAQVLESSENCSWWVRDAYGERSQFMNEKGEIGTLRPGTILGVRPAVWLDMDSEQYAVLTPENEAVDNYTVGGSVTFGTNADGMPMTWTIMSVDSEGRTLTVLADESVCDYMLGDEVSGWYSTDLRAYLNSEFMASLTDEELFAVLPIQVEDANGMPGEDYISCPSVKDCDLYASYWFVRGSSDWKQRYEKLVDPMHESYWFRDSYTATVDGEEVVIGAACYNGWEMAVTDDFTQLLGVRPMLKLDADALSQLQ